MCWVGWLVLKVVWCESVGVGGPVVKAEHEPAHEYDDVCEECQAELEESDREDGYCPACGAEVGPGGLDLLR